ncbi:hypothetical protein CEUSTIGMA_g7713.t1 [Chlamydomonas eustigma]|uniref:EF-hand domain-containing protein n=1 Tax=Chlamydomonas eustigma TaxID=1157962 RepID=A0A250XB04_9CHLO|nr:hypothetical protein CEUSTIGMA_g7713.t1 [Chlamydomonas eustigma]|eukprot:GAX80275.1 hypothetical protein CEUSTIGMA_g7713.t1 [Chlamydomonas eustigma]
MDPLQKAKLDFDVFASGITPDGARCMTEDDLMQCFGVRLGHTMYERMQQQQQLSSASVSAASAPSSPAHDRQQQGITLNSFLLLAGVASAPRSSLQEAFSLFDTNEDGYVSLEEFKTVVQHASVLDRTPPMASSSHPLGHPHRPNKDQTLKPTLPSNKMTGSLVKEDHLPPNLFSRGSRSHMPPRNISEPALENGIVVLSEVEPNGINIIGRRLPESSPDSLKRHNVKWWRRLGSSSWMFRPFWRWKTSSAREASADSDNEAQQTLCFTQRYFGADGKGMVSYEVFAEMVREMNLAVLRYKWLSMAPSPEDDTVSLVSFGRLLVQQSHRLPPVLARNLLAPENLEVRLSFRDFVVFEELLENLAELQQRLDFEIESKGELSRCAFDGIVRSVSERRIISHDHHYELGLSCSTAGNVDGSGSMVMDILFRWLDTDKSNTLSKKEVAMLLPLLHQQNASTAKSVRPLAMWETVLLAASAAAVSGTVMFPLDTIKSRMMNGQGSSMISSFRDIIMKQGPLALYRGLPAQLVGIMPENALKLTFYNTLRTSIRHRLRISMGDHETLQVSYAQEALAGMGTASVQVLVTNPYELIKVRQQTAVGKSITDTIREIGLGGLSQGMAACLLRDIPFNALYFSSYAYFRDCLKSKDGAPLNPQSLLVAGLGAGLLAGAITTPADVIHTRMQTSSASRYKGILDCMTQMWHEGGYRSFVKGIVPRMLLIPPVFAINLTCFETFQRHWLPQTVASPGLRHLPGHLGGASASATMTDMVKHQLEQLESSLAYGSSADLRCQPPAPWKTTTASS